MSRVAVGTGTGIVATIELGKVNLVLGSLAAFATIICLLPTGIKNYRDLIYDYRRHKTETGSSGFFAFVDYLLARRVQDANAKTAAIPVRDGSDTDRPN